MPPGWTVIAYNAVSKMRRLAWSTIVVVAVGVSMAQHGQVFAQATIKKCQDASGKWHYGDIAAEECARSRITEMDQRGLKVREHDVPPTREEVEARDAAEARRQAAERLAEERRQFENRLLATYDSEQSIIQARDQRVAAIDKAIKENEEYMAKLDQELRVLEKRAKRKPRDERVQRQIDLLNTRIAEYERSIEDRLRDRDQVIARYDKDLAQYRDIRQRRGTVKQ